MPVPDILVLISFQDGVWWAESENVPGWCVEAGNFEELYALIEEMRQFVKFNWLMHENAKSN